ncbi:MAG: LiaI-LiaF-like domain-containing protein [Candidatus Saccharicenans sp.]
MEEKIKIEKKPGKSPALAGIFSAIFPGAGAIYNGSYLKGILFMIIFAGLVSVQGHGGQPFVGLLLAGFYFFQLIEAINEAKRISSLSEAEPGTTTRVSLEAEMEISRPTGSISWGLILILLGGLFLLANFEVISYDSFIRFWPLALVVLGLKLLVDYFASKKS